MEIPKHITEGVKNSVGYAECDDKASFFIGSNVAFARSEEFYAPIIKALQENVQMWKLAYETVNTDMSTIVNTLSKYSSND